MRLSGAGARRQTKLIDPDHRLPPWFTADATRDRSNQLLCVIFSFSTICDAHIKPRVRFEHGTGFLVSKRGRDCAAHHIVRS